jgi:hypothetical protein
MPLSWNLGTLTSWNPLGHSRHVTGLLYLRTYHSSTIAVTVRISFPLSVYIECCVLGNLSRLQTQIISLIQKSGRAMDKAVGHWPLQRRSSGLSPRPINVGFLVNDQRAHNSLLCICFNYLHVSNTLFSSSGETNCINTTSGICQNVSVTV